MISIYSHWKFSDSVKPFDSHDCNHFYFHKHHHITVITVVVDPVTLPVSKWSRPQGLEVFVPSAQSRSWKDEVGFEFRSWKDEVGFEFWSWKDEVEFEFQSWKDEVGFLGLLCLHLGFQFGHLARPQLKQLLVLAHLQVKVKMQLPLIFWSCSPAPQSRV